jgi:hypothetical protein
MKSQLQQTYISFAGGNHESAEEVEHMLESVLNDAESEQNPEIKQDLNSLAKWLQSCIRRNKTN